MIFKQLALLGLIADSSTQAKKSFSNPEFRQKFEKRLLQKTQQNLGTRSTRGFLSAITAFSYCGEFNTNAQFEILSDYLIENNGKKVFYSHFGKFVSAKKLI